MIRFADNFSEWVSRILLIVSCILLLAMMLHITGDVARRFFFNRSLPATLEMVTYYYMVGAVFLAMAYVEKRGEHIRVDLFAQMFPRKFQLVLYIFGGLVCLLFFFLLAWQGYVDAVRATDRGERVMSRYQFYIWPSRWAIPVGIGALMLVVLSNMLKAIARREAL